MKKVIKKYSTFLKYILVAVISFLIDISLFTLFNRVIIKEIIISTILARIISSFINYLLNRDKVFKSGENSKKTIIKYYILVVVQMLVSAFTVKGLKYILKIDATLIKIPVECVIFICNYFIQKLFIFKRKDLYEE